MSGWHKFDFTVVLLALPDLLEAVGLDANLSSVFPTNLLRILRIARVARVLRLIKSSKGLQSLLTALLLSLPAMANLSGIFLIVQFLYAVLGMQLFGKVTRGDYLNADANFCSFGTAFLTMFRCATGESWNGIMHDCMVTPASLTLTLALTLTLTLTLTLIRPQPQPRPRPRHPPRPQP